MENVISVSQLNNYVKSIFEAEFMLQNILVYGEVSSFNISNGIGYFSLKDENSLLSCLLFSANNFKTPVIGDMIIAKGSMSYYVKGGRLSFNAISIQPYGKGVLYEKFLELKNKLENKGYFAVENKKQLPERVKKIGVVSSETGAVIQDIIDVATRRNNMLDIVLYPVKVQGVGAELEIAKGIDFFSNYGVDVVIVARGGGSIEDLQAFNTEIVAEAAFNCKKPLVSAVGHETDYTILDFVSDLRAPTPSAAAEIVAWSKEGFKEEIFNYLDKSETIIKHKLYNNQKNMDLILLSIEKFLLNKLNDFDNELKDSIFKLNSVIDEKILRYSNQVEILKNTLEKVNPVNLAKKGYLRVLLKNNVIKSVLEVTKGDSLLIDLLDGEIEASVVKTNKEKGKCL